MILNADLKAHISSYFYDDDYGQTGYRISFWIMTDQMLAAWQMATEKFGDPDQGYSCAWKEVGPDPGPAGARCRTLWPHGPSGNDGPITW
ncbi:MAG TPA: hypothetical protein VM163_06670 [bacterium]|nr:hypothetical protein [bacterium]